MEREVRVATDGREFATRVRAGARATVEDLARALDCAGRQLWLAGRPLPGTARLVDLTVPIGALLRTDAEPGGPEHDRDGVELVAVGGAGGAARAALPAGSTVSVGRAPSNDLVIADPEVSRVHATARPTATGFEIADAGSRNGVAHRGVRLVGTAEVAPGEVFSAGETVFTVRPVDPADGPVGPVAEDGTVPYNRPPRIGAPAAVARLSVPRRPERPRAVRFPLLVILLPLVIAGGVYKLLPGAGYFLIFLALSPVLMLATVLSDRRSGRNEHRAAVKEYERARAALVTDLERLADEQGRAGRDAWPDPARLLGIASGPGRRLYERRPADQDFLHVRLGLGTAPARVDLDGEFDIPAVEHLPSTVDLAAAGVLGLAGPREAVLATTRAVIAHLGTLHAPHDLGIVVLTGTDEAPEWEWASWLPHTVPHTADLACQRMIATDAEQARARLTELRRIVAARRAERQAALRASVPAGRRMIVVADGARRLRGLPELAELLTDGPDAGVYAICVDVEETDLPAECRATAVISSPSGTRARLRHPDGRVLDNMLLDRLSAADAAALAHALAPLRVLGGRSDDDGGLPDTVRLLDLAGLGHTPTAEAVARRWAASPGGRSATVPLGVGAGGPFSIDLSRDGPHLLIAGTSGAGKSELLQTLVAGLALVNPPDALAVVLVDYKGGSAFAECRNLPHCAGMVTDLDGHLVARALASLSAELRRREALLAEVEAKDIAEYWATTGGRLPRLVIVIDEFASLVEEVPEFVTGVAGIGMRGRSLGVHVVLATQRPAGVVTAELRANLNLRICLRVTSASESSDVVDVPDAVRLSRHLPGRAYLRAGHGDLALLQAARIGGPRSAVVDSDESEVLVRARTVGSLGHQPPPPAALDDGAETDLAVLVDAIRGAAEHAGLAAPASPWLPPLPPVVVAADLAGPAVDGLVRVAVGLADLPSQQAQRPYVLDLASTGPVLVAGMARSGRSTALRTIAAGLASAAGPADVHLYILDQGNHALAGLAGLPHCGAYVDGDDTDRTARVLRLLDAEIGRRQRLLAAGGHASLAEQRAGSRDPLPYLVLIIDRYETFHARFAELDGGRLVDAVDALLRRGPAAGVLTVLSTDRSGFTHRLAGAVATRLVLAHADRDDLAAYGINPREAPGEMPPGRAIACPGGQSVQVALLDPEPDGAAQAAALDRLCAATRHRWDGVPADALPQRVDPLPSMITSTDAEALRSAPRAVGAVTVGVGGDQLGPVDVDLAELGNAFLISGPQRSGRSGALLQVARSLVARPAPVVALCPRRSPLTDLDGLAAALVGTEDAADLALVLQEVGTPVAVLVDDAELLAEGPAALTLESLVRTARDAGSVIVAAGTTDDLQQHRYRGWLAMLRRARTGLLLNPLSHVDGELFDIRLPRSTAGGWPAGRGLLVTRGQYSAVQVPASSSTEPRESVR
ncbi:FtsK/SpoIIIE domain-containing protein [Dactylosporangium sp. CA-152071]|uniref:FtsK/SpoIIIE domain-containing protein n=1 Tax=Dactylosporangium sp. CA-152071 TaxID=3239933 RepID=UPI003D8E1301